MVLAACHNAVWPFVPCWVLPMSTATAPPEPGFVCEWASELASAGPLHRLGCSLPQTDRTLRAAVSPENALVLCASEAGGGGAFGLLYGN